MLALVQPAAPDAQHVKPGVSRLRNAVSDAVLFKPAAVRSIHQARRKRIVGNPVRAFCINIVAVDAELKSFAVSIGIRLADQLNRAQPDLSFQLIDERLSTVGFQTKIEGVKKRLDIWRHSVWLPALHIRNRQTNAYCVSARAGQHSDHIPGPYRVIDRVVERTAANPGTETLEARPVKRQNARLPP